MHARLKQREVPCALLDTSFIEQARFALTDDSLRYWDEGREVSLARSSVRGWLRRLAPPEWRRDAPPSSHEGVVRSSWIALLLGLARACRIEWLTEPERLFLAENKLAQYAAARELGMRVPASVVTSSSDFIPADLGDPLVAKPLGPGQFTSDKGEAQALFASELHRAAPELDALAGAPFLLQARIEATAHLRIVTVGERIWVCVLDARKLPLDWRRIDEAHGAFVQTSAYDEVGELALALARALRVGYSSQDWAINADGAHFLDLNPSGQWLFLPDPVASEVTAAIAGWLAGD